MIKLTMKIKIDPSKGLMAIKKVSKGQFKVKSFLLELFINFNLEMIVNGKMMYLKKQIFLIQIILHKVFSTQLVINRN